MFKKEREKAALIPIAFEIGFIPSATFVAFYALGIARYLPDMAAIRCPLQLHYGLRDQHVPASEVAAVSQAMQRAAPDNARLELHRYDAGHSFFNNVRPGYDAAAAGLAAERLDALLEKL